MRLLAIRRCTDACQSWVKNLPPPSKLFPLASMPVRPVLVGSPDHLKNLVNVLWTLLAPDESKEYLVIFENNDELRATGGFAGTFLLVKFDRGTFTILDAPGSGPFDLTAQTPQSSL